MTVSWPRLFATIVAFFLVFDVLFGCLFHLVPELHRQPEPARIPRATSSSASRRSRP